MVKAQSQKIVIDAVKASQNNNNEDKHDEDEQEGISHFFISVLYIYICHCLSYQYKKEDVVQLPMRQIFTGDQMTQELRTIGHCTAFNNEQSPYHKVCYKSP